MRVDIVVAFRLGFLFRSTGAGLLSAGGAVHGQWARVLLGLKRDEA